MEFPRPDLVLLKLTPGDSPLPDIRPGQFVEVRVSTSPQTFLRRPISINYVDRTRNELWLLVHCIGPGTRALAKAQPGDRIDCLYPLGKGFRPVAGVPPRALLIGGGVGTAPLLHFGRELHAAGRPATFILGGKTAADLLQLDLFRQAGTTHCTTEAGSLGTRGFVTAHPALAQPWDYIATCGPKPMMQAVARIARERGIPCEASLENLMACGLGACLCCVEPTGRGNLCVCKEGPVFDTSELNW